MYAKPPCKFVLFAYGCILITLQFGSLSLMAEEVKSVDFHRDVRPIFEQRCFSCHGAEKQKSGLRLDVRERALKGGDGGAAIVPGKSAESPLARRIASQDPDERMPAKGEPLTGQQIELIKAWIDQGASWVETAAERAAAHDTRLDHWAYQPVRRPEIPKVKHGQWVRNPIDAFILAKLEANKLTPSPEADPRTLIRRLNFDLLGLPPQPEAVDEFIQNKSRDVYTQQVDALLASPQYGERWARHWLDVVRFAETHGFEMNQPRNNAWPYRDYVIRAFNEDKPYNQFVTEQLAGDAFGVDEATGFIVAGPWDQVKSPDPVLTANQRADELHDMVSTTGSALLGLTVGCARCHNHKFDPITQNDYYALKACLAGVQHGERAVKTPEDAQREHELSRLKSEVSGIEARLNAYEPRAFSGQMILIDDEPGTEMNNGPRVQEIIKHTAKGTYPAGSNRGERDDAGNSNRCGNFTPSYLAWDKVTGENVMAYEPRTAGRYRIWLSWGCGWHTHAKDAHYLIDRDGDLSTTNDQVEIAVVDQQKFADRSGEVPDRALWSGFYNAGVWELTPTSKIVLRAGATDAFVSADVIALQQAGDKEDTMTVSANFLRPAVHPQQNSERFAPVAAKRLRFIINRTTDAEPCIDELEVYTAGTDGRNVALTSNGTKATTSGTYPNNEKHTLEHLNDGRYGNSYSWISNERGKGWVVLEFPETVTIDRVVWGRDREEKFTDRLALDYRIEVSTTANDWKLVASSQDRQFYVPKRKPRSTFNLSGVSETEKATAQRLLTKREQLKKRVQELEKVPTVYAGKLAMQPETVYRLQRGDPMQPREVIAPGAIEVFPVKFQENGGDNDQHRRLALAKWVVDPANPLTARVMVNRIWQYHFGEGLVSTPSDFGINGARPTHPELLDWLAAEFVASGWSVKHIQRLILNSATFRQASDGRKDGLATDAGSRLLWRFPPRRLDAEPIRDATLAVSGKLDLRMGGPGFSFFAPNENYVRVYNPKKEFGPEDWRRMVYGTVVRQRPDTVFGAFDCPDGGQIAPRRNRSTTPLQALNLLNSEFMMEQAHFFAERLETEAGKDPQVEVQRAFALAFQRKPDASELSAATQLVRERGLPIFCRALFNANEFVYLF